MVSGVKRPTFEDRALQRQLMELRRTDNITNLLYLALEYFCLGVVIGSAVYFAEFRGGWGLSWWWNLPVFATAIVLIGGLQHRLAGLGHESAHYSFMRHRYLNDLIPDVFCMFPLMSTIHFYRLFHLGHHQFTNDPARDPDLLNLGHGKRAREFPMTRSRFISVVYLVALVAPLRFLQYQWAYIKVNTFGTGQIVYSGRGRGDRGKGSLPRLGTALGIFYVFGLFGLLRFVTAANRPELILPSALSAIVLAVVAIAILPGGAIFRSPFRGVYSPRVGSMIRLGFYTVVLAVLAYVRIASGGRSAIYPVLLWFVPLGTSFMFFMFLRDVYQHSNADRGRLTNSRVFFADPISRWAVFVYGQDMHIPHHLFPAVPHFRLRRLHDLLRESHPVYRTHVVETHGTFRDAQGRPTILDEMTRARADAAVTGEEPHQTQEACVPPRDFVIAT
jgi:fatty acid desaturase